MKSLHLALLACATLCIVSFTHAQSRPARPRLAHEDQTPAERCTGILALWMTDARAALTELGVEVPANFETRYRRDLRNFDASCATLTPVQLACIETAPNSIAAVGSCGVNEGRDFNTRINPPMIANDLVTWQAHNHEARSEATTREALTQLTGTWRLADRYSEQTFTVNADGSARYVNTRGGATQTHDGTIDVLSPTHIQARMGFSTFNWPFFVDGNRVLFSNQTATGAYPIATRGVTRLAHNGHFFLVENVNTAPQCRAFGPRLEPAEVSCAWEGTGDARKLIVTLTAHRSIESGSQFPAFPTRFVVRRNHLIPDGDSMFWTRVTQ